MRTASTVAGALLRTAVRTSIDAVERRQFDSGEGVRGARGRSRAMAHAHSAGNCWYA